MKVLYCTIERFGLLESMPSTMIWLIRLSMTHSNMCKFTVEVYKCKFTVVVGQYIVENWHSATWRILICHLQYHQDLPMHMRWHTSADYSMSQAMNAFSTRACERVCVVRAYSMYCNYIRIFHLWRSATLRVQGVSLYSANEHKRPPHALNFNQCPSPFSTDPLT